MGNRIVKKRNTPCAAVYDYEKRRYSGSMCHWEGMPVESWISSQFNGEQERSVLTRIRDELPHIVRVRPMRLVVASWNVGSVASKGGLNKLSSFRRDSVVRILRTSFAEGEGERSVKADIICVCLQEIVPLDSVKTWMKRPDTQYKPTDQEHTEVLAWVRIARAALPDPAGSWLLYGRPTYMCGLLSLLLVRSSVIRPLRSFGNADLPVDQFNIGTKGAVALCFRIHDTSVCVCNVHLQAHTGCKECTNKKAFNERKQQIQEIRRGLSFPGDIHNAWRTMDDHHMVIFCGDTNMRLEMDPGKQEVTTAYALKQINNGEKGWQELKLEKDQLTRLGEFDGFVEPSGENLGIFPPTFKLFPRCEEKVPQKTRGGADFSTRYNTKRVPAWTDRVLLREWPDNVAECVAYSSVVQEKVLINNSVLADHDPVYAAFVVKYQDVDVERLNTLLAEAGLLHGDLESDLDDSPRFSSRQNSGRLSTRCIFSPEQAKVKRNSSLFQRQTAAQLSLLLKSSVRQELDGGAGMTSSRLMLLKERLCELRISNEEQKQIEEDTEEEWLAEKMRSAVREAREQTKRELEAELAQGVDVARDVMGDATSHRVVGEVLLQALTEAVLPLSRRWTLTPPSATGLRRKNSSVSNPPPPASLTGNVKMDVDVVESSMDGADDMEIGLERPGPVEPIYV